MAEHTPRDPGTHDRTPRSYSTEPPRPIDQMEVPPGTIIIPEGNYIHPKHNIFIGAVVAMVLTSLLIFWAPLFNGLLGGAIGGFLARRWGRALGAALVASLLVPGIIAFAFAFDEPDFQRFFSGLGFDGWFILHVIGTFIGALSGVASQPLAERRQDWVPSQLSRQAVAAGWAGGVRPKVTSRRDA